MHDFKCIQLTHEKSQILSYLFKIKSKTWYNNISFCKEFFSTQYFLVFNEVLSIKNLITLKKFEDFPKITKIKFFR